MFKRLIFVIAGLLILATSSLAQQRPVTLAGFAYSGDAQTIKERFPYTSFYEAYLKKSDQNPYLLLRTAINQAPPQYLTISDEMIDKLAGRDQAVAVALVVNSETVSVEEFGRINKLTVHVRGQAMFFDFKTMTVLRSYPLSFAVIDLHNRPVTDQDVLDAIVRVYQGGYQKAGLFGRFADVLSTATIPDDVPRFVQVSDVTVSDQVKANLPDYLKSSDMVTQTWIADMFSEAISQKTGIPMIPYSKGYAVGNIMSMRVADGRVFSLKLPSPDYEIHLNIPELKKILHKEVDAGASYIYGAYADVKILEPLSNSVYFNSTLKNGEIKIVPATQTYVDDFPAYYDAIDGLFNKLGDALNGNGNDWIKKAATSSDVVNDVKKTHEVLEKCK